MQCTDMKRPRIVIILESGGSLHARKSPHDNPADANKKQNVDEAGLVGWRVGGSSVRPSKPWEDAGGTLTEVTAFEGHWSPTPWEPSTDRQTQQWPTLQPSYQQLYKSAREADRRSSLPNLKTCKLAATGRSTGMPAFNSDWRDDGCKAVE